MDHRPGPSRHRGASAGGNIAATPTPPQLSKPLPKVTPRKPPPSVQTDESPSTTKGVTAAYQHLTTSTTGGDDEARLPPSVPVKPYPPRLTLNGGQSSSVTPAAPFTLSFDPAQPTPSNDQSADSKDAMPFWNLGRGQQAPPAPPSPQFAMCDPQFYPRKYRSNGKDRPDSYMSTSTTYSARAAVVHTASRKVLKKVPSASKAKAPARANVAPPLQQPSLVTAIPQRNHHHKRSSSSSTFSSSGEADVPVSYEEDRSDVSASDYDPEERQATRRPAPARLDFKDARADSQVSQGNKVLQTPLSASSSHSLFFNAAAPSSASRLPRNDSSLGPTSKSNSILSIRRPSADGAKPRAQTNKAPLNLSTADTSDHHEYRPGEWGSNAKDEHASDSDSDPNLSKLAAFSFPSVSTQQQKATQSTPAASSSSSSTPAAGALMGARKLKWKEAVQMARLQERQAASMASSYSMDASSSGTPATTPRHHRAPSSVSAFSLGGFSTSNSYAQLATMGALPPIQSVDLTSTSTKDSFLSTLFASQATAEVVSAFAMPPFDSVDEFESAKKELRRLEQRLVDKKNKLRTMKRLRGAVGKLARAGGDNRAGMGALGAASPLLGASLSTSDSGTFSHTRGPSTAPSAATMTRSRSKSILTQPHSQKSAPAMAASFSSQSHSKSHSHAMSISSNISAMTSATGAGTTVELENATEQVDKVIDEMQELELKIGELRMRIREHVARVLSRRCEELERRLTTGKRTGQTGLEDEDEGQEELVDVDAESDKGETHDVPRRRVGSKASRQASASTPASDEALQQLRSEMTKVREEKSQAETKLHSVEHELKDQVQNANARAESAQAQLATLQNDHSQLVASHTKELESLRREHENHVKDIQSEHQQSMQSVSRDAKDATLTSARITELEGSLAASKRNLGAMEKDLETERTEKRRLNTEFSASKQSTRQLEAEKAELQDSHRRFEADLSQSRILLAQVQAESATHTEELNAARKELSSLQNQSSARTRQLQNALSSTQTESAKHARELDAARKELAALNSQSSTTIKELQNALSSVQSEVASYQHSAGEAEDKFCALEVAVSAERRIMAERDALFHAFESRLERAEETLREQDKRCALLLGKSEGREELDDFLAKIRGGSLSKKDKTAGQDIDDLLVSLREHIEDLADELNRRAHGHSDEGDHDSGENMKTSPQVALIADLESRLDESRAEIAKLTGQVESDRLQIDAMNVKLANSEGASGAGSVGVDREINSRDVVHDTLNTSSHNRHASVASARQEQQLQQFESTIAALQSHNDELRNEIDTLKSRLATSASTSANGGGPSQSMESFDDGHSSLVKVPGSESEGEHQQRPLNGGSSFGIPATNGVTKADQNPLPVASAITDDKLSSRENLHKLIVALLQMLPCGLNDYASQKTKLDLSRLAALLHRRPESGADEEASLELSLSFADLSAVSSSKGRKVSSASRFRTSGGKKSTPSKASTPVKKQSKVQASSPGAQSQQARVAALRRRFDPGRSMSPVSSSSSEDEEEDEEEDEARRAVDAWLVKSLSEVYERAQMMVAVTREVADKAAALEAQPSHSRTEDRRGETPTKDSKKALPPDPFTVATGPSPSAYHHIQRNALSRLRPLNTTAFLSTREAGVPTPSPSPGSSPSKRFLDLSNTSADLSPRTAQELLHEQNLDSSLKSLATRYGDVGPVTAGGAGSNSLGLGLASSPLSGPSMVGRRSVSAREAPKSADSAMFRHGHGGNSSLSPFSANASANASATTPQRSITLGLSTTQLVSRIRELERQLLSMASFKKAAERVAILEQSLGEKDDELKVARAELDRVREEEMLQKAKLLEELNNLQVGPSAPAPRLSPAAGAQPALGESPSSFMRRFKPLPGLLG